MTRRAGAVARAARRPRRLGAAVVTLGCAVALVGGTGVATAVEFSTANKRIECAASQGARGSGVNCYRLTDGRAAIVQWSGAFIRSTGQRTEEPARGAVLRPGRTRTIRFSEATYRCTAQSAGRIRCVHVQRGYGFVLGMSTARTFRR